MVDIKRDIRFNPTGASISTSDAIAQDVADIEFANVVQGVGQTISQVGLNLIEMDKAYQRQAEEADNNAVYANSINQATIQYQNLFQERINQVIDDDGNPTFSTLQDDVAQIGRDVLEEWLDKIDSPEVRARLTQNFNAYTGNQQIASISIQRNQQLSFISDSITNSVSELATQAGSSNEQDRVYFENQVNQILNEGLATGAMTPEQVGLAKESFRKNVSTAIYRNAINNDPVIALDILEKTSASDLKLTELERLSLQNEAQVAANRLLTARDGLANQQQKYIRDQLNGFEKIIDAGNEIPQDAIDEMSEIIVGTGFEERYINLLSNAKTINQFTMFDPVTRTAVINELFSDKSLGVDKIELRDKLSNINNAINQKIDGDVYSLAIEQGIIDNQPPFDAKGDISEQLADRQATIQMVERHYQKRTSGLTQAELSGFQEAFNQSTYQVKAGMLGDVVAGLGDNAYSFFEEVAINGYTETAAIGSLMIEGKNNIASTVLEGQDILEKQRDIIPADYRETDSYVREDVLPFYLLHEQEQDIRNMAKAYYAALTHREHDFGLDTNEDRLTNAYQQVSNGGALFFNNSSVESPVASWNDNDLKRWIRGVTLDDINKSGGFAGFHDDSILRTLRNSNLITKGRGQYVVMIEDGSGAMRPIKNNSGEVFVLDYNVIEGNARDSIESFDNADVQMRAEDFLMTGGF